MKAKWFLFALLFPITALAQVSLRAQVDASHADPIAGTLPGRVTIVNARDVPLDPVSLTFRFIDGEVVVTDPAWTCAGTLTCRHAALAPQSELSLELTLRYPEKAGRFLLDVTLGDEGGLRNTRIDAVLARPFVVRTAEDAGEGSLRDAIERLNADPLCAKHPCRIDFAIDGAISLQSPLPALIAADVEIDAFGSAAALAAAFQSGSFAAALRNVQLLGSNLHEGDGLDIRAARALVRGLAIGFFPGNGIRYAGNRVTIEQNYIGVDPTGMYATPNGGRGIVLTDAPVFDSAIRDNVISGNLRSGVMVNTTFGGLALHPELVISGNRIGVAAHSEDAIPNGASGVFVGPEAAHVLVTDNVIAHNEQFGVSIALGAKYVQVSANRMFDNANLGIDIALDGPTPEQRDFFNAVPVLLSATYEPAANATTITGTVRPEFAGFYGFRPELYANDSIDADGYAETEQLLGTATPNEQGRFRFTVPGDLRGKYISAVTMRSLNFDGTLIYDTSELSRALRVE